MTKLIRDRNQYTVLLTPNWKPRQITEEQATAYYNDVLLPRIAGLDTTYPVESVRRALQAMRVDGEAGRFSIEIQNNYGERQPPTKQNSTPLASFGLTPDDGAPTLILWIPAWMDFEETLQASVSKERALTIYQDVVVEVTLHEHYHLTHSNSAVPADQYAAQQLNDEVQCWAYVSDQVIEPMRLAGRHPVEIRVDSSTGTRSVDYSSVGWSVYKRLGRDPANPEWIRFISKYITNSRYYG
jgi:hypothetical protein